MVIVPPCGLAETVTPPMALPSADVTVPLSRPLAKAGAAAKMRASAVALARIRLRVGRIERLPLLIGAGRGAGLAGGRRRRFGGRRNGFDVGDDGVDLGGLEGVFEARHARRAVADELTHGVGVAAKRVHRQLRAVLRTG